MKELEISEIKRSYDALSKSLEDMQKRISEEYAKDAHMTRLYGDYAVYPYFAFISQLRKHEFITNIVQYSQGYESINKEEYEQDEKTYARSKSATWNITFYDHQRKELIQEPESIRLLKKESDIPLEIPLIHVQWEGITFFHAQLADWIEIETALKKL